MTNEIIQCSENELKHLSNEELLLEVKNLNMPIKSMSKFIKNNHHNPILDEVISRTSFLDETVLGFIPILARLYCLEHNLTSHPECQNPECVHKVEWRTSIHGFAPYCSLKCRSTDPKQWERIRETTKKRYGVSHYSKCQESKTKFRETCQKKYGVDNVFQLQEIKEKCKKSMMDKYGVENSMQSEDIKEKAKQTCRKKFGVDNAFQSEEIKNRIKQTHLQKRGVDNSMKAPDVQEKYRQTMMKRYGVEYSMQSKELQKKSTETCLEHFGVEHPSQSSEILERTKHTMNIRHGVDWFPQSYEYHKLKRHKFTSPIYPGMSFDSNWELFVYDYCSKNNINVEYQPNITLEYQYDDKIWTYHPDFKINGKVYEVKGDQFFRINETSGEEEMYCPYRNDDWSDEHYDWICGKYNAKYKCILSNGIHVIRKNDLSNLDMLFE